MLYKKNIFNFALVLLSKDKIIFKMKRLLGFFVVLIFMFSSYSFEMMDTNALRINPQPIKTTASVYCDYGIQRIEVYNLLGNLVIDKMQEGLLDFSELPSGYYLVKAYTAKGEFVKRVYKI
jgi:hypothetical protein